MNQRAMRTMLGWTQVELLIGLSLGLSVQAMALQAWNAHRTAQNHWDAWQELQDRTPALHRLLSRLTRQAGGRPLTWNGEQWTPVTPFVALPSGPAPTWVHARGLHAQPALYPNCQNTRVWAKDVDHAPAELHDQFNMIDGQLKCKDTAQTNARWQTWVEQVPGWKSWLAWRSGSAQAPRWQWRPVDAPEAAGMAIGVRLCLNMESAMPVPDRPTPPLGCQDQALKDQGRLWRVWSRVWSLRSP